MKISPVISFLIYPFLIQRFEDLDLRRDKNIWSEISRITSLFFQSRMWFDVTKEKRKWKQKIINYLARKKVDEPLHLKNCIKLWAVFTIVTEILLSTKNRFFRKCHKKNMVNAIREFFFFFEEIFHRTSRWKQEESPPSNSRFRADDNYSKTFETKWKLVSSPRVEQRWGPA